MDKQAIIKALRDTAQSASNSAASNLSAPVDAIAWALRKAGLPIPENAVGGSDWMAQKGLTAPVQDGLPKMAGEVIGNLAPVMGVAKAPQIAAGMNRMVDNAMAPATLGKQRGVFGGIGAKTADMQKLDKAKQMIANGENPSKVWRETGWGTGPDGKWRFEISDHDLYVQPNAAPLGKQVEMQIGLNNKGGIKHTDAVSAYPSLTELPVFNKVNQKTGGFYNHMPEEIQIYTGASSELNRSALAHELQHAIQKREGFAGGGDPELLSDFAGKNGIGINDAYQRLAGEAESRLVQSRLNMDAKDRAYSFPWNPSYFKKETGVGIGDLLNFERPKAIK